MNSQKLTTSVAGKTEVADFTAKSDPVLDRLVGSSNQHSIVVNGMFTCFLDTGSIVTTIGPLLISCNHIQRSCP